MARLHEYQGKAILAANGFKVPRGRAASTADDAPGLVAHVIEEQSCEKPMRRSIPLNTALMDRRREASLGVKPQIPRPKSQANLNHQTSKAKNERRKNTDETPAG
jgi:hypothetical protein